MKRRVVLALVLAVPLLAPEPAFSHGGPTAAVATSFVARITSQPAGIETRVIDGDQELWLNVPPGEAVLVLGLSGEPYLRFGPEGVEVNEHSPTAYLNRAQPVPPPAGAGAATPPGWQLLTRDHNYRWHEDRLHALAATVRSPHGSYVGPWAVPLKIDGRAAQISGSLWYVRPPTRLWLWPLLVELVCLPGLLRLRSPRLDTALSTTLALIALAAIVAGHLERNLYGRPTVQASQLGWLAFACGFAVVAAALLRRPRWRALAELATATYALAVGLTLLPALRKGNILGWLPASIGRLTATAALTAGAGTLLVIAARSVAQSTDPTKERSRQFLAIPPTDEQA